MPTLNTSTIQPQTIQPQIVALQKTTDANHQLGSMIQAMAAFAPPSAAESKVLVGVYDMTQPMLASQV
jgi:hypothetical protein